MNELVPQIIWGVLGLAVGAVISSLLARSRQHEASAAAVTVASQASTALQIELSSAKEWASRVPELERELAASVHGLNLANERKVALESEVLRLPELESRRAQAADALEQAVRTGADLRDLSSRLTAELAAERDNLAALRTRVEETQSRFDAKAAEASALAIEVAQLRNTLESERSVSQDKLALLLDAKQALIDHSRLSPMRFSRRSPSDSRSRTKQTWALCSIP
jgi:hypothetical protein